MLRLSLSKEDVRLAGRKGGGKGRRRHRRRRHPLEGGWWRRRHGPCSISQRHSVPNQAFYTAMITSSQAGYYEPIKNVSLMTVKRSKRGERSTGGYTSSVLPNVRWRHSALIKLKESFPDFKPLLFTPFWTMRLLRQDDFSVIFFFFSPTGGAFAQRFETATEVRCK